MGVRARAFERASARRHRANARRYFLIRRARERRLAREAAKLIK